MSELRAVCESRQRRHGRGRPTLAVTSRQIDCLRWAQEGKTSWEIGQILGISSRTVESYLAIAFERLEVNTRVQAVLKARAMGLI